MGIAVGAPCDSDLASASRPVWGAARGPAPCRSRGAGSALSLLFAGPDPARFAFTVWSPPFSVFITASRRIAAALARAPATPASAPEWMCKKGRGRMELRTSHSASSIGSRPSRLSSRKEGSSSSFMCGRYLGANMQRRGTKEKSNRNRQSRFHWSGTCWGRGGSMAFAAGGRTHPPKSHASLQKMPAGGAGMDSRPGLTSCIGKRAAPTGRRLR